MQNQCDPNGIKTAIFSKRLQEIAQLLGALPPHPNSPWVAGGRILLGRL